MAAIFSFYSMCVRETKNLILLNIECNGTCTLHDLQKQYLSKNDLLPEIEIKIGGILLIFFSINNKFRIGKCGML